MELALNRISKTYKKGSVKALDNFSVILTPGVYGLLGPNGAGKSTLMNIITEAKQRSEYVYDVDVTGEDKILTLSTCSYKYDKRNDVRFVVMAKLLDEGEALQKTVQLKENTSKKTVE